MWPLLFVPLCPAWGGEDADAQDSTRLRLLTHLNRRNSGRRQIPR